MTDGVIPAYLGWGNPERDNVGLRLYATDKGAHPRWAEEPGGRVAEYAIRERFGAAEGDRFLIVRVGDRFLTEDQMRRASAAIAAVLDPESEASG